MDRIEELMREGRTDEAMELLDQMRRMMENMQAQRGGESQRPGEAARGRAARDHAPAAGLIRPGLPRSSGTGGKDPLPVKAKRMKGAMAVRDVGRATKAQAANRVRMAKAARRKVKTAKAVAAIPAPALRIGSVPFKTSWTPKDATCPVQAILRDRPHVTRWTKRAARWSGRRCA